ncbi:MAG: peptidyl-prolyl cis-trans isomerase [Phycisphaerales bacterium]|nr:peptidyl-prolyl cis-trans isomerase [Phycisphaerales bacterium]
MMAGWAGGGEASARTRTQQVIPPAMIDGAPVEWDELRPLLAEAAGSVILQEIALGRALKAACRAEGVLVTPEMIARERDELARVMSQAGLTPDEQGRVAQRVLASRGIGDARLQGLLERNAMLRAIASRGLVASEDELREAHDVLHGERVQARIIVCRTSERAFGALARIRTAVEAGTAVVQAFAAEATAVSTDASSARGGAMEPVSVRDRRYGENLRSTLATTSPGQVSGVFAIGDGWAFVLVEGRLPPDGVDLDASRTEVERLVLARKERARMQEIGESLQRACVVEASDPSLRWSWRTRAEATDGK